MTSTDQYLAKPGHFKVRTFAEVPADSPSEAVGVFIDKVNKFGLWNFWFFVYGETGQQWVVNLSEPGPLCITMEEYVSSQTQMGLGPPADPNEDDDDPDDVDDVPPAPPKPPDRDEAGTAPRPAQRPTRTQAATVPTTPAASRSIPTDPHEAIRARRAQRDPG